MDIIIENLEVDLLQVLTNLKSFYLTKNNLHAVNPEVFLGLPKN